MVFNYSKPVGNCTGYRCFSCKFSLGKHKGCLNKEKLKKFISLYNEELFEPVE